MARVKIFVQACDAPGCLVARRDSRDEPALGYHLGKIAVHEGGGGVVTEPVYACSQEHIQAAVDAAIKEAWNR